MATKELKTKGLTQAELLEHAKCSCIRTVYKKGKQLPKVNDKDKDEIPRYEAGDIASIDRFVEGKLYTFTGA